MNFGAALAFMKLGALVRRSSWGEDVNYIYIASDDMGLMTGIIWRNGPDAEGRPQTWHATHDSILATDWELE